MDGSLNTNFAKYDSSWVIRIKISAFLHKIGLPHLFEVSNVFGGESIFMAPGAFIFNRKGIPLGCPLGLENFKS